MASDDSIYPFVTKQGSLDSFKTVGIQSFNSDFLYGDIISGSHYPYRASIKSDLYTEGLLIDGERKYRLLSLKNTLNYYKYLSPHFSFSSSYGDKELQELKLISIPSIMYGKKIKKRTVSCKWYHTGSLVAELQDANGNGELIQVGPEGSLGSGSVAGVVLYSEGFLILTGSWTLSDYVDEFKIGDSNTSPSWKYFMTTGSEVPSTSFSLDFEGEEEVPVVTLFAKAEKGELNHSNNPTYVKYGQETTPFSGNIGFNEQPELEIKNVVTSLYDEDLPDFKKITYISKIAIYDEERNLIGIAKLAKPVKKEENDSITFKLKLDL